MFEYTFEHWHKGTLVKVGSICADGWMIAVSILSDAHKGVFRLVSKHKI